MGRKEMQTTSSTLPTTTSTTSNTNTSSSANTSTSPSSSSSSSSTSISKVVFPSLNPSYLPSTGASEIKHAADSKLVSRGVMSHISIAKSWQANDEKKKQFSHSTLVNNWDALQRWDDWNMVRYCRNRAAGGLMIEKTSIRSAYLLKDVFVKRSANFILYDQTLQICAPHVSTPSQQDKGVYLSATLSDFDEVILTRTSRSCQLSWSSHNLPCNRNVFILLSVKAHLSPREAVKYGDEFYITTISDEDHELLYIEANYKVLGKFDNASNHSSIRFTPYKSGASVWKALAAKPEERESKQGTPIYLDEYIHVLNVRLGQKLSVETSYLYQTLFGKEFEATAHNHMTLNGKERIENCVSFTANVQPSRQWPPTFSVDKQGKVMIAAPNN